MSPFTALVMGMSVAWSAGRLGRSGGRWGAFVAGVGLAPGPALVIGVIGFVLAAVRRRQARRQEERAAGREVDDLARLLVIGTSAGWTIRQALTEVAEGLRSQLGSDVGRVLRRARTAGLGPVLVEGPGPGGPLFRVLARAHLGGAPLDRALAAFVRDRATARRAAAVEAARRLPVRMVVPLTLLMLPGFVLLVAGPAVLLSGRRLLEPLLG